MCKQNPSAQKRYKCCIVVSPLRPSEPLHPNGEKEMVRETPRWESLVGRRKKKNRKQSDS
jgi:hypothetical protein